ncbi:MAG: hypothetical protein A2360_04235 [Candidatus Staskawiczbacteria bacterium RIFOXYB1_FULL_32_11]|uniref:ABC transporter domain-containing protein n=1 Tax=Candidatus Staskawiczbacteria bacterium RIFOXYD1_FULL_32_13 TaxID=1802234 RepID=A0A1G2JLK8_9BACT|nr:MAG: Teichoic acid ABC transporter [Parcubacteria group bacterium GW2011_GWC2_32_10]OGZ78475.1 MAG: hypothetical protein A2360_04235 [Candidatus Staskawiczbacteria bacterium RIFOXYB1_FULL_32_11]OGZ88009.1 MAG: hypothetical protein A2561_02885 [Candidatus Staskawiczbacteria bacterium RIFOXYD1_FULL_32_13]
MIEKNIEVLNLTKKFDIGFKKNEGALSKTISFLAGRGIKKELTVLKDVSFYAYPGEVIGLIGKNGSGKSTLLRIIAGIYEPDKGEIKTSGRVFYISGLSNGLKLRLTMQDNIYLMSAMMGLDNKEIKEKFSKIVEFSGLGDFLYTKVYQFSSGMVARLSFSVTIFCLEHSNPDILILDEVFGSGADAEFEEKASKKMAELIKRGSTVILASHNLKTIREHCSKVIFIDNGKIIDIGSSEEIINEYKNL